METYPADRDRDEASDVWSEAPALQDQRSQTELTSNVLAILERDAQELQQQDSNSFFTITVQGLIRGLQEAEHDNDRLRTENAAFRRELQEAERDNDRLRTENAAFRGELQEAERANDRLRTENAAFRRELQEAERANDRLRTENAAFRRELQEAAGKGGKKGHKGKKGWAEHRRGGFRVI